MAKPKTNRRWDPKRTEVASLTLLIDRTLEELGGRASKAGLSKKTVKSILHDWHMRMHQFETSNKLSENDKP